MIQVLTVQDWLTSSGKYPWRAKHKEATLEVLEKAEVYVLKLNLVLWDLGIRKAKFSSGFRPSGVNKKTPNASKTSTHMTGEGGDLEDVDGALDHAFLMNLQILEKHGLYLEHPNFTETWAHTQSRAPKSQNRVFRP